MGRLEMKKYRHSLLRLGSGKRPLNRELWPMIAAESWRNNRKSASAADEALFGLISDRADIYDTILRRSRRG